MREREGSLDLALSVLLSCSGPKLSFHTAASQARANANAGIDDAGSEASSSSAARPSFTISRNVDQQQQHQQVIRPQLTSTGRSLTLRGAEGPVAATPRGFMIQTTADDGREVRRPQQQKKRSSGHLESSAADSASSSSTSSIGFVSSRITTKKSLGRVTVVNESAMIDEQSGGDSGDGSSSSAASFSKRSRITITNGSAAAPAAAASSTAGGGFAMWDSDAHTQAFLSSLAPAGPLPVAAPMPGLVKFNPALVDSVARARNERLQSTQPGTNVGAKQGSPFGGAAASPLPTAAVSAASSAAASSSSASTAAAPSSRPSAPAGTTVVLLRNLHPSVTAKFILTHLFGLFDVRTINVDTDGSGQCSGTAEAHFLREADAEEAIALGQGQIMHGQPVRLSIVRANNAPAAQPTPAPVVQQVRQPQTQQQQPQQSQQPQSDAWSSRHATSLLLGLPVSAAAQGSDGVSVSYIYLPSYARRPQATGSPTIDPSNPASVFSNPTPLTNVGFVFEELIAAAGGPQAAADTVFNITNKRGAHVTQQSAAAAAAESSGPLVLHSGVVKAKTLQLKPKAGAVDLAPQTTAAGRQIKLATKASTAAAAAHVPAAAATEAASSSKPSFKLNRQPPLSSVVAAPEARQPKSVVLAPAKQ